MGELVNIDGQLLEKEKAFVNVFDHGFLFGDSVYEVVRTHFGVLFAMGEHMERLRLSAGALKLEIPFNVERLVAEVKRTVDAAGNEESYVRIIVSRGVGELELHPGSCHEPGVIIIVRPYRPYDSSLYQKGAKITVAGVRRTSSESLNPSIKSGNYLNNVLASMEARERDALEAIMLNHRGEIAECTTSNLFLVSGDKVKTPSLRTGILSGITRSFVIKVAKKASLDVEEGSLPLEELYSADEVFITSTLKNVMPVTRVDERIVGDGSPGTVTKKLAALYDEFVRESVGKK